MDQQSKLAPAPVEELGGTPPSYDFCHEKLGALVDEDASLAGVRMLHRRATQALARAQRLHRDAAPPAAIIANHLRPAGDEDEAATHYKLAGDRTRALDANSEAHLC